MHGIRDGRVWWYWVGDPVLHNYCVRMFAYDTKIKFKTNDFFNNLLSVLKSHLSLYIKYSAYNY